LWAGVAAYFLVRFLALHTLLGGYTGGVGDGQTKLALAHWLDIDTYHRFLVPLAASVFSPHSPYATALPALYGLAVFAVLGRACLGKVDWRWLAFTAAWTASAALPIYRLWGLGMNLEAARFCFFLTMPFCFLLPAVLLAPLTPRPKQRVDTIMTGAGLTALTMLALTMFKITLITNAEWVHAGKEVRRVTNQARLLALATPIDKKLLLLGIPKDTAGAHLILNGDTFRTMMAPPFAPSNFAPRFLTFDPITFAPPEFINTARFKQALIDPNNLGPFIWDRAKNKFVQISLDPPTQTQQAELLQLDRTSAVLPHSEGHADYVFGDTGVFVTSIQAGDCLRFSSLNLDPLDADYLLCEFYSPKYSGPVTLTAKWTSGGQEKLQASCPASASTVTRLEAQATTTVLIPLSRFWRWYSQGRIDSIDLLLPPVPSLIVRDVRLLKAGSSAPVLTVGGDGPDQTGLYKLTGRREIEFDARGIDGAQTVQLQIGKTNFFFDQFAGDKQEQVVNSVLSLPANHQVVSLKKSDFGPAGFYEVRARAIGKDGRPLGDFSNPVTFNVN
jgi:hypothetical protein